MAGHSKWANIKHRKAGQDAKRGKIFTKLIRELAVAAKVGGGDVAANPRLRTVLDKALSHNMTRDTIQRAIQRGVGGEEGANMESITYEGYGPGGTAVLVECLSDNRNRTVSDVRYAFSQCAGNLGTDGSVAYLFEKQGLISFTAAADEEALFTLAIEAGAHDLITHAASDITIITQPEQFNNVQTALVTAGYLPQTTELTWVATTQVMLDASTAPQLLRLIDLLEDLDDVQAVHHNANITDTLAAELSI